MDITVNIERINIVLSQDESWDEFVEKVDKAYAERHPGMAKDDPRWLAAGMSTSHDTA